MPFAEDETVSQWVVERTGCHDRSVEDRQNIYGGEIGAQVAEVAFGRYRQAPDSGALRNLSAMIDVQPGALRMPLATDRAPAPFPWVLMVSPLPKKYSNDPRIRSRDRCRNVACVAAY